MRTGEYTFESASVHVDRSTSLPHSMREGILEVSALYTPAEDRRRGFATSLMREVVTEADNSGKVLMLIPHAFSDGTMSGESLIQWYQRFGFKLIQKHPQLMARQPRAKVTTLTDEMRKQILRQRISEAIH